MKQGDLTQEAPPCTTKAMPILKIGQYSQHFKYVIQYGHMILHMTRVSCQRANNMGVCISTHWLQTQIAVLVPEMHRHMLSCTASLATGKGHMSGKTMHTGTSSCLPPPNASHVNADLARGGGLKLTCKVELGWFHCCETPPSRLRKSGLQCSIIHRQG